MKLISDIVDAAEVLKPAFIAIAGTPIPTMTGFDFEAVASVIEQRTGIPSFGFPTTGMNTYIHGASMALAGIAERFVDDPATIRTAGNSSSPDNTENTGNMKGTGSTCSTLQMSPRKLMSVVDNCCMKPNGIKVNILGLTPLDFSTNGQDESIVQWLRNEGFEVVSKWAMGSSLEDIRRYLRSVLSEGLYERLFGDSMASGFDELEQNEVLDKEHMKQWIEYRGKLYQYCPYGGWGKLPVVFSDSYPVIIADKTETSCTAYFPEWYIEVDNFENCVCMEVKLILDPEFNDWRIDNVQQFEGRHYGELYDMLNS